MNSVDGDEEADTYGATLSLVNSTQPLRFKVEQHELATAGAELELDLDDAADATFDLATGILNIPFVKEDEEARMLYDVDLEWVISSDNSIEFELQKVIPIH